MIFLTCNFPLELTRILGYSGTMGSRSNQDCIVYMSPEEVENAVNEISVSGDPKHLNHVGGLSHKVRIPAKVIDIQGSAVTVSLPWGAVRVFHLNTGCVIIPSRAMATLRAAAEILLKDVYRCFELYSGGNPVVASEDGPKSKEEKQGPGAASPPRQGGRSGNPAKV